MLTDEDTRSHQKLMFESAMQSVTSDKYLFIYGGQGTFKTTTSVICLWQILAGLGKRYTGLRVVVGAISYRQLRDAFIYTWQREVPSGEYVYDRHHEEITLTGVDAVILLRHAGDASEGKSAERAARTRRGGSVTGFYFPQAESLSHAYFSQVESMLRGTPVKIPGFDDYPPYRIRFLDANPEGQYHFLARMFIDPTSEIYIGGKSVTFAVKTTPETSAYSADQIDTFRTTWAPHRVARMLDAQWVGATGLVYEAFSPVNHVTDFNPPQNCTWYLAVDFGYHAPFCALLIGIDYDGRVWVLDEFYAAGVTIDQWAQRLAKWWPDLEFRTAVVDPAQPNDWRTLEKHMAFLNRPIDVILANKAVVHGIQLYTARLARNGFENIHKRCQNFISELLLYEWENTHDGRAIRERPANKGNDHALDARRYFETTIATERAEYGFTA